MAQPYAYEIDDSETFGAYMTKDAEFAEQRRAAGKRVLDLFVSVKDAAAPTRQQREDAEHAQRIVRDAEAMAAIRRLRHLSGVDCGATLAAVVDAVAARLSVDRGECAACGDAGSVTDTHGNTWPSCYRCGREAVTV